VRERERRGEERERRGESEGERENVINVLQREQEKRKQRNEIRECVTLLERHRERNQKVSVWPRMVGEPLASLTGSLQESNNKVIVM
jgi:hypothetical protein